MALREFRVLKSIVDLLAAARSAKVQQVVLSRCLRPAPLQHTYIKHIYTVHETTPFGSFGWGSFGEKEMLENLNIWRSHSILEWFAVWVTTRLMLLRSHLKTRSKLIPYSAMMLHESLKIIRVAHRIERNLSSWTCSTKVSTMGILFGWDQRWWTGGCRMVCWGNDNRLMINIHNVCILFGSRPQTLHRCVTVCDLCRTSTICLLFHTNMVCGSTLYWGAKTVQRHVRKCRTALKPWSLDSLKMLKGTQRMIPAILILWLKANELGNDIFVGPQGPAFSFKLQLKCRMDVLTAKCRMVWNQWARESQRQTGIHLGAALATPSYCQWILVEKSQVQKGDFETFWVKINTCQDSPWRGLEVKGSLAEHGCVCAQEIPFLSESVISENGVCFPSCSLICWVEYGANGQMSFSPRNSQRVTMRGQTSGTHEVRRRQSEF